jgi:hypothetical protein
MPKEKGKKYKIIDVAYQLGPTSRSNNPRLSENQVTL